MKLEYKLEGKIVRVVGYTQYILTSTFLRLQEFYESPYENINGQYFTLEEYMDTYATEMGNFTYCSDWSGFNVPGHIFKNFVDVFDGRLLEKEKELIAQILELTKGLDKFYIIGHKVGEERTLDHEVAHALYYLNEDYRREADEIISKIDEFEYARAMYYLLSKGYMQGVIDDEIQAYLSTDTFKHLKKRFIDSKSTSTIYAMLKMRNLFKRYTNV